MLQSEKQFNTKATTEAFDEIYTNYDISVNEDYLAQTGYPFDYPTKWLNDPSMNKRIAIRRLDVTPSSHSFKLIVTAIVNDDVENPRDETIALINTIDVSYQDSLIKVLNHICSVFSYEKNGKRCGLRYAFDVNTNRLAFSFFDSRGNQCVFTITGEVGDINEVLKFLNQTTTDKDRDRLKTPTKLFGFYDVWSRDRLHFHASFSTSRRKFIGKRGDFYQTLTLLYPSPTNESTFYIRFTSNGIKNILIRHCEFDIQLCFIVNYKKSAIL